MAAHALPCRRTAGWWVATSARAFLAFGTVAVTLTLAAAAVAVFTLHLGIRPVLSPSMKPAYGPGWAIVTRDEPTSAVHVGDIVVFTPPGSQAAYAHRVVKVSDRAGATVIETKGDANTQRDAWQARLEGPTVPHVVFAVPWLGRALVAIRSTSLRVVVIAALGLLVCLIGTRAILRGAPTVARPRIRPTG